MERIPCYLLFRAEVDFRRRIDSLSMSKVAEEGSQQRLGEKRVAGQVVELELASLEPGTEVGVEHSEEIGPLRWRTST